MGVVQMNHAVSSKLPELLSAAQAPRTQQIVTGSMRLSIMVLSCDVFGLFLQPAQKPTHFLTAVKL